MPSTPGWLRISSRMWATSSGDGASPSSVFTVSCTRPSPLTSTNTPSARPTQPSSCKPVSWDTSVHARTASVESASLRESVAVAASASDSIRLARVLLNAIIHAFTAHASSITTTSGRLVSTASGWRIRCSPDRASSMPTAVTSTDMTKPARYSKRP